MDQAISLVNVMVWRISRRGTLEAIGLSPDEFQRPRRGRYSISSRVELVGEVRGQIYDWVAGGGWAKHLKLHWVCPKCGYEEWGDWLPGTPNPCLWFGNCGCVEKWLISYDPHPINSPGVEFAQSK